MFYRLNITKDSTISNISTDGTNSGRASGSNVGMSPLLQIFALKDRIFTGSLEWARSLLQFDVTELSRSIFVDKTIPSSSVTYTLKMPNYIHGGKIPTSFELFVYPLSRSWTEGTGSDVSKWRDYGFVNWLSASSTQTWTTSGSDFLSVNYGSGSQLFDRGQEDLEMNVTQIVGNWLTSSIGLGGGLPNNGLIVKLGNSEENNGVIYDTKMFHSRESKFVDRLPFLEARWDTDVIRDNRKNFAYNNWNKLYFYNFIRGELTSSGEPVFVQIKDSLINKSASWNTVLTASRVSDGIYSCSLYVNNFTSSFSGSWYDIWISGGFIGSGASLSASAASSVFMTGTFSPMFLSGNQNDPYEDFDISVNMKDIYQTTEQDRIKVSVRKKNIKKTHLRVVHSGSVNIDRLFVEKMYYSIVNDQTNETVVPFGTGSTEFTRLSYNGDGNYFDTFFNWGVPGFVYRLKFQIHENKSKKIYDESWKFKVI